MPNSTARRAARATKPRHHKARTTDHRTRENAAHGHPAHRAGERDQRRRSDTRHDGSAAKPRRHGADRHHADRTDRPNRDQAHHDRPHRDRTYRDRPHRDHTDRPNRTYRDQAHRERPHRDRPDREQAHREQAHRSATRRDERAASSPRLNDTRASVSFAELGLPTPLLRALDAAGITEPFPIQAATLPDALAGRDVLGRAQTGSGKTLAFGLALLTRLRDGKARPGHPRALVLVPTRELATQVTDALMPLAKALGLWCRTVVGGLSFSRQADQLRRGIDLLIATPGRLSDHVRQGTCVLDDVGFVALDEADQMADMGFMPQVRAILDLVPDGQRMLFSATLDGDVAELVDRYLTDPVSHSTDPVTAAVSTMEHHLLLVSPADKAAVVAEMAARDGRTIMFLRTKHHVDRLTHHLRAVGVRAGALHGGLPQGARNRVLGEFRDGRLPVLVATDVAARGIHVDDISLVVHVDPPADAKGYLHRAGRTARAGAAGTVVTVVTHRERRTVFRMTERAGVAPERTAVRPGAADLVRITGARTPSGEPVVDEPVRRPQSRPRGRFTRRPARRPGR